MVTQSKKKGKKPAVSKTSPKAGTKAKATAKSSSKKAPPSRKAATKAKVSKVKVTKAKVSKASKTLSPKAPKISKISKAAIKSTPKSPVKQSQKPLATPKTSLKRVKTMKTERKEKIETRKVSLSKSSTTMVAPLKAPRLLAPETLGLMQDNKIPYKFEAYHAKTGEVYMNDAQLRHFREILEKWKKELMKEVDNTISEMKGASVLADPNDRATQEEAFNLELRTRDRERKLIRKIEEALQQIDDKEYGYCESCGVEIGIRRLEARPTAALCIDCKTLDEIRERTTQ